MKQRDYLRWAINILMGFCVLALPTNSPFAENDAGLSQDVTIAFSHVSHAGDYAISCDFCHYYAARSPIAGVPSLIDCLGCHQTVKGSDADKEREITRLNRFWLTKQPLVWSKKTRLPDFVYFSHQSHYRVGITCEKCHGDLSLQDDLLTAGRIKDLTMGWCVDCHVEKQLLTADTVTLDNASGKDVTNQSATKHYVQGSVECQSCHK